MLFSNKKRKTTKKAKQKQKKTSFSVKFQQFPKNMNYFF